MSKCRSPIGVFDSGIGGLTVVNEIIKILPHENIVYFGDTARVPYGNKSKDTVMRYSTQIVNFLKSRDVKAIVVACNTASALALEALEKKIDIPIIGVVKPGAYAAIKKTKKKRVGVIATHSTVQSGLYQEIIKKEAPDVNVFSKACPLFVPLVEEGWTNDQITLDVAKRYLTELQDKDIDTLILGCTHYPLLLDLIAGYLGETISLINPAYETARALKMLLEITGLVNDNQKEGDLCFCFSDLLERHILFTESILKRKISNAYQISAEEY